MNFLLHLQGSKKLEEYIKEYYEKNLLRDEIGYGEFKDLILLVFRAIRDEMESGSGEEIYVKYLGSWKIYHKRVFAMVKSAMRYIGKNKYYGPEEFCKKFNTHIKVLVKYREEYTKIKKEEYYNLITTLNKKRKEWLN